MRALLVDDGHKFLPGSIVGNAPLEQQFIETGNGMKGRPELVRNIGDELGLHLVEFLQGFLSAPAFSDVLTGTEDTRNAPEIIGQQRIMPGNQPLLTTPW
jgi:hypothetical protein